MNRSLAAFLLFASTAHAQSYTATRLVDNICCELPHTDPRLVAGWGMASSPTGPTWVVSNFNGTASIYDGAGTPQALFVRIEVPFMFTPSNPAGIVFNNTTDFIATNGAGGSGPASFIIATQEGSITAWTSTSSPLPQNTQAFIVVNNTTSSHPTQASYTGLVLARTQSGNRLYAPDFLNKRIDAFNASFSQVAATFTDPGLPQGLSPYNMLVNGNQILVAYAQPTANRFDVAPIPGVGVIDVYTFEGQFVSRLVSGGPLNAPWGMAIAPADFGPFSGALLIANNGDGRINAFNPNTGAFLGALRDSANIPLFIDGIRGLHFGNGFFNQPTNTLYFTTSPSFAAFGEYGRIELTNPCYANCDRSTAAPILNVNDFQCFLSKFAAGDPVANCDGSNGIPFLSANDFQCFLNRFAAGCT